MDRRIEGDNVNREGVRKGESEGVSEGGSEEEK